eukprot:2911052-Rhodomonas_salina.1
MRSLRFDFTRLWRLPISQLRICADLLKGASESSLCGLQVGRAEVSGAICSDLLRDTTVERGLLVGVTGTTLTLRRAASTGRRAMTGGWGAHAAKTAALAFLL